ncbi:MAG: oligosaccharide flippase family protein [Chloroflexi bacterium]|nr:oligosaccharide flippase family protein [Chloroflexota bacterium]
MTAARLARRAREIGPFGASVGVYQGARFIVSMVAAAQLGPTTFGAWVILTLVLVYASLLTIGIPNGAGLEIPVRLGAGDAGSADEAEEAAMAATLAGGALAAIAVGAFVAWYLGTGAGDRWLVAGLLGLSAFAQQLVLTFQMLFRSRQAFDAAAAQFLVGGVVLASSGLLLVRFGLVGLATSLLLGQGATIVASLLLLPRRPGPRWDPTLARRLTRIGLPLLLAGFGYIVLTTIDRWLVVVFLGQRALGVYGLVGLVEAALLLAVSIVSQQEYPKMAHRLGGGADHKELLRLARGQGFTAALLSGAGALAANLLAWLVVPALAPAYREALVPMAIVSVGVVAYGAASGYGNLLNTVGRQREYLAVQVGAIAAATALMTAALVLDLGLTGVAAAVAAVLSGYALVLRARAQRPTTAGAWPSEPPGPASSELVGG